MNRNLRFYCLAVTIVFCLLFGGQIVLAQDPGIPGPFDILTQEYDFGNTAFTPPGFPGPVEVTASVHYPMNLTAGPFPLVIFMHGRHVTCFEGTSVSLQWPCAPPRQSIPSYRGYNYIAEILASHGYIVVSISANGINARDNSTSDLGMLARAQLIQHHLDLWNTFNTTGGPPFGNTFVGKVDLNNVGTMGHSRGGEGVVRHFVFNRDQGSPYNITTILPLAPTNFSRNVINNIPLAVMLPYCDGDVSDLQGVHFFDDALYNVPGDVAPKHTILVMGANHNFFNTIWTPSIFPAGSSDDWVRSSDPHCGSIPGNQRLTDEQQRGTALAYITGFFRTYLGGESSFVSILAGNAPPPPSAMTDAVFVSFHPPDNPRFRRDVNRLLAATNLTSNTLGGVVTQSGLTPYDLCGGEAPQPRHCLPGEPTSRQPHTTESFLAPTKRGLSQLRIGWDDDTAIYRNDLPAGSRDVSGFFALQFRAAVNFADSRNPVGTPQDFSVTLTDGDGDSATLRVSDISNALFHPPGQLGPVPKVFLNTIRIPLAAFIGVDLTDIRSVQFNFDQESQGAILISDIAFMNISSSIDV